MEPDSMSNIWNSNCIMQARHTAGRSDGGWGGWGEGGQADPHPSHFYDIKDGRKNARMRAFFLPPQQISAAPPALSCGSAADVFSPAQLILQSEEKELPQQNSFPALPSV